MLIRKQPVTSFRYIFFCLLIFRIVMIYKTSSQPGFSPSQRWRSTTCHDPFPYCRVLRSAISSMKYQWNSLPSESLRSKYLNLLCIETNEIEGTFSLDFSVIILSPLLYGVRTHDIQGDHRSFGGWILSADCTHYRSADHWRLCTKRKRCIVCSQGRAQGS